eukprot:2402256-Prymnesium_polylepis.1
MAGQGREDAGERFRQQLNKQRRMPRGSACGDVGCGAAVRHGSPIPTGEHDPASTAHLTHMPAPT